KLIITRTAFDARDAVRDGLPDRFNLRRPWISRGIGVTPAKPRTLMAEVWSRDRFMALREYQRQMERALREELTRAT
ncbi:MAG: hypothetical protein WC913_10205, partial [Desulfuromonas sp.]